MSAPGGAKTMAVHNGGDRATEDATARRDWRRLAALACAFVLGACQQTRPLSDTAGPGVQHYESLDPSTCSAGQAGCPCDPLSAPVSCGEVTSRRGDYVTCALGQSICVDGSWSACSSAHLVTKSVGAATVGRGGLRLLSSTAPC